MLINPQVLFNISQTIINNQVNNNPSQGHIGVLLGIYNPQLQNTEIKDSFEVLHRDNLIDQGYLNERFDIRSRGEQWNLFKNLSPVGWYTTSLDLCEAPTIHKQLCSVVQDSTFKYLIHFNPRTGHIETYIDNQFSNDVFTVIYNAVEPSIQEVICITAALKQDQGGVAESQIEKQLDTVRDFEALILEVIELMSNPLVSGDLILMRDLNQILNSLPHQDQPLVEEYAKINILAHVCLIQSMKERLAIKQNII